MDEQITVVAKFRAKPEATEKLIEIVLEMVRQTRLETGCLNYDFHRDLADPALFYMHENWTDEKALAAHFETSYFKAALTALPKLMVDPVEIHRLKIVEPKA